MTTKISDSIPATSVIDLEPTQIVCAAHGAYQSTGKLYTLGAYTKEIRSRCPTCESEGERSRLLAQQESAASNLRAQMEKMVGQTMVPARFVGRTFESYLAQSKEQQHALETCRRFADGFHKLRGASLVLAGKPGTGKSHLAAAILQQILPTVGLYITIMDMIRLVRDTWRRDSQTSETEVLAKLAAVDLLVIDEIGAAYGTDGERAIVFDVIDKRYRSMKSTILITNLDKTEFRTSVGDRVYDRLVEVGKWISFDWQSHRATARKENQ